MSNVQQNTETLFSKTLVGQKPKFRLKKKLSPFTLYACSMLMHAIITLAPLLARSKAVALPIPMTQNIMVTVTTAGDIGFCIY